MKYSARSIIWLGLVFWAMTPPGGQSDAGGKPAGAPPVDAASGALQATMGARIESYCRQDPGACMRMVTQGAQLAAAIGPAGSVPAATGQSAGGQGAGAGPGQPSGEAIARALTLAGFGQDTLTAQDRAPMWRGPSSPGVSAP